MSNLTRKVSLDTVLNINSIFIADFLNNVNKYSLADLSNNDYVYYTPLKVYSENFNGSLVGVYDIGRSFLKAKFKSDEVFYYWFDTLKLNDKKKSFDIIIPGLRIIK